MTDTERTERHDMDTYWRLHRRGAVQLFATAARAVASTTPSGALPSWFEEHVQSMLVTLRFAPRQRLRYVAGDAVMETPVGEALYFVWDDDVREGEGCWRWMCDAKRGEDE